VTSILLAGGLFAVFWATGKLLCDATRRRLRGGVRLALPALLGACAWLVALTLLSQAGLPTPRAAVVIAAGHAPLLALVAARRRRGGGRTRPPGRRRPGGDEWLLGLALGASLLVSLLPVLLTGGYASANDTFLHCAVGEWLQDRPLPGPLAPDADSPISGLPSLLGAWGRPLAATQAVALAQAIWGGPSLRAYPVAASLSEVLIGAALFLVARWPLCLPGPWAAGVSLAFAVLPQPLAWGHHHGFLSQAWGSAGLLLLLALLGRASRPSQWRVPEALAAGLALAFVVLVYVPFAVVAAGAVAAHVGAQTGRAHRTGRAGRLLAFWSITALGALLLCRLDVVGLVRGFVTLVQGTVGGHVGTSARGLAEFALGVRALGLDAGPRLGPLVEGLTPPLALAGLLLLAAGGVAGARKRPAVPAGVSFLVLLAGLAFHAVFRLDPWTGMRGHTWGIFKLLQWQYPLVLLLQAAGLHALQRRLFHRPGPRHLAWAGAVIGTAVAAVLAPVHVLWARQLGRSQAALLGEERPLEAAVRVQHALRSLPPGRLLLLGRPANRHVFFGAHLALLAWPRPIVGDWRGSAGLEMMSTNEESLKLYETGLAQVGESGWVPLSCAGLPPGGSDVPLGGGCTALRGQGAARVVGVTGPGRVGWPTVVGGGRTKVLVLAPAEAEARLRIRLGGVRPGEDRSLAAYVVEGDYDSRAVRRSVAGAPVYETRVDGVVEHRVRACVRPGLSTIVLALRERDGAVSWRPGLRLDSIVLEEAGAADGPLDARAGKRDDGRRKSETSSPCPSS
jgi:hypothetical protein